MTRPARWRPRSGPGRAADPGRAAVRAGPRGLEAAPETARERRKTAARFARVERWAEDSGNAALMGRELPPDEVLACDQRICWWAAELRKAGLEGGMDELRARAFLDLVLGKDSRPRPDGTAAPAAGVSTGSSGSTAAGQDPGDSARQQRQWRRQQWRQRGAAASRCGPGGRPGNGGAGGFAGRVTLTVPLGTAAGLTDRPGELGGHGPVDPWLARDLVDAAAANPKTTWCVTVTDQHGHAVGHGCARPEPRATGNGPDRGRPAGPGTGTGPGSASPRPAGTGRPADTAPGGCPHRAAART